MSLQYHSDSTVIHKSLFQGELLGSGVGFLNLIQQHKGEGAFLTNITAHCSACTEEASEGLHGALSKRPSW